ncbi:MAG: ComF family protein [Lachnospiraceae bacterium]|nr:ComF family protein [Lachnospiraceae bacterium]
MGILEILYPARCPICHGILKGRDGICPECRKKLPYIREPKCKKCGKQMESAEEEYCRDCKRFSHAFDRGAAVYTYNDVMARSIAMFKYHNRREYAKVYAKEMYRCCSRFLKSCAPEVILPVPIHRQKKRQRGFNQAELVAKELGKLLNVPVDADYLIRKAKTIPQKELTRQQRKRNLKEAFEVSKDGKYYKRVLLIDDIYTTGATMDAVSEILRENQTKIIFFLTICVGRNS